MDEDWLHSDECVHCLRQRIEKQQAEIDRLRTPPIGYPECTTATIHAMHQPHGDVLLRMMHANEQRIEKLTTELAECRRLLREAVEVSRFDDEWWGNQLEDDWFVRAAKAGGE